MNKLISISLFLLLGISVLGFSTPVFSAETKGGTSIKSEVNKQLNAAGGKTGANYQQAVDPRLTAMFIIRIILTVLGVVFLILTIYAGFTWMTAGGNDEKVEQAKKMLQRSIIGLIIIFSAYSITIFAFKVSLNYFRDPLGGGAYYSPQLPQ